MQHQTIIHGVSQTQVVPVTPALAKRWLKHNTRNRSIRESVVTRYVGDMINGRWKFAGDPIRFDSEGVLIDGQHRLAALAKCDEETQIDMLVITGLDPESQMVMDQGSRRNPGDQLGLKGIKNGNYIAAAVKQILIWDKGMLFRDANIGKEISSSPAIQEWVEHNPEAVQWMQDNRTSLRSNDANPSIATMAGILFWRINPDAATEFFRLLNDGAGAGNPINTLDKRLQRMRREGIKWPHRDQLALFIQAWNAWVEGKNPKSFPRPRTGWTESTFPQIKRIKK